MRFGENVSVQSANDAESDHEQKQLPVQHLVQAAAPQEQQFGESSAGRRRHLVLVADCHRADDNANVSPSASSALRKIIIYGR